MGIEKQQGKKGNVKNCKPHKNIYRHATVLRLVEVSQLVAFIQIPLHRTYNILLFFKWMKSFLTNNLSFYDYEDTQVGPAILNLAALFESMKLKNWRSDFRLYMCWFVDGMSPCYGMLWLHYWDCNSSTMIAIRNIASCGYVVVAVGMKGVFSGRFI